MKDVPVQINETMSIFDNASVEKQIKRRDSAVKVDANLLRGTAATAYADTRAAPDDIRGLIAECGYYCPGEVLARKLTKEAR